MNHVFAQLTHIDKPTRTLRALASNIPDFPDLRQRLTGWADEFAKSTSGLSQGAVRLGSVAAGKLMAMDFNGAPRDRSIDFTVRVVDDAVLKQVLAGRIAGLRVERRPGGEVDHLELAEHGAVAKTFDVADGEELRKVDFSASALHDDLFVIDGNGRISEAATLIKAVRSNGPQTIRA